MRSDLMLYVASTMASQMGHADAELGMVAHDGEAWYYELMVREHQRERASGFASHTDATAALLAKLAELGEPEKMLARHQTG